jgi:hypothetical protein
MSDALKTFIVRNPAILTAAQINVFGIESHPTSHQSAQYTQWLSLCQVQDVAGLEKGIVAFLQGSESIKTLDDLGPEWSSIVRSFLSHGPEIDKETAVALFNTNQMEAIFGRNTGSSSVRTRVADTMLGLARMKSLGLKGNMDYQAVLRVMTLAERATALNMHLPEGSLSQHFEKPILMPPCFFKLDRCKPVATNLTFPFLPGPAAQLTPAGGRRKGCTALGDCTCKTNDECLDQNPCCAGTLTPCVVDLMVVRDATKCYQAGDLSFIKNVLSGESVSTRHRRLDRTETVASTDTTTTTDTEKDLQSEDRSALHREIADTITSDTSLSAGVTSNAKWGAGSYSVTATANASYKGSKTSSNKDTTDYSKSVISRAVSKVEEKIQTSLKTTNLSETVETNQHKFANETGPNVSGQYLYVEKLSRAQVYNYGKKAVLDFYLPEPAALFIKLLEDQFDQVPPAPAVTINMAADQITPDNYLAVAAKYGLKDIPAPPPFQIPVVVTLQANPGDPGGGSGSGSVINHFNCVIPPDYVGVSMSANVVQLNYNQSGGVSVFAYLGGSSVQDQHDENKHSYSASPLMIEGTNDITVHSWDVTDYTWILTVMCDLKSDVKVRWQIDVFNKFQEFNQAANDAYQKALDAYQSAKNAFDQNEAALRATRYNRDPFINRQTEQAELKRMAIAYISCQFFDGFDAMKTRVKPCGYPEMDLPEAEQQGLFIRFFEQAFTWDLMTYIFYPYFWGRKCTWADKLKVESGDLIFERFLAAGSARVLVPIRDGFLDLIQYFLATGEIWGGTGIPPLPNDPHYVSMAQEVKEQDGNYYADRDGSIDVTNGSNVVTLNNTDVYWTYADPLAKPPIIAGVNSLNVAIDVDREIIIDCNAYRIVDIQPNPLVTTPTSWLITIERNYEGVTATSLKWSTGALFVGAPWEFVTPTSLTFLREKSNCLPCYPLKECKEGL